MEEPVKLGVRSGTKSSNMDIQSDGPTNWTDVDEKVMTARWGVNGDSLRLYEQREGGRI